MFVSEATLFTTNFTRLLEGRKSSFIKARADVYDQTTKENNISKQDAVANRVLKKIPPNKVSRILKLYHARNELHMYDTRFEITLILPNKQKHFRLVLF